MCVVLLTRAFLCCVILCSVSWLFLLGCSTSASYWHWLERLVSKITMFWWGTFNHTQSLTQLSSLTHWHPLQCGPHCPHNFWDTYVRPSSLTYSDEIWYGTHVGEWGVSSRAPPKSAENHAASPKFFGTPTFVQTVWLSYSDEIWYDNMYRSRVFLWRLYSHVPVPRVEPTVPKF